MKSAPAGEAKYQIIAWGLLGLYVLLLAPSLALPPIGRESWRETDILIVGRNFCRERAPLWEPRVDARGDGPGITGMEFPILNFVEGRFGCGDVLQVVTARVVTLVFSILAAWALYRLTYESVGQPSAVLSLPLFIFSPLVFYYSRSVMPDLPSISLALIGNWLLRRGLLTTGRQFLISVTASALAFALGIAIKLPAIVYALPALVSIFELRRPKQAKALVGWLIYGAAIALPAFGWYSYALNLQERSHLYLFALTRSPSQIFGDLQTTYFYRLVFLQHAFDTYAFPFATGVAILGALRQRSRLPPWAQALGIAALIYLCLAGNTAAWHPYYGIPAVPAIAVIAAIELASWIRKWPKLNPYLFGALLLSAPAYTVWRTSHWFPRRSLVQSLEEARRAVDLARPPNDRTTVFSGGNPRLFWFFDRKGWLDPVEAGGLPRIPPETPLVLIDKLGPDEIPYDAIISALGARGCSTIWISASVEAWSCEGKHE
jgi:hypothetical protein